MNRSRIEKIARSKAVALGFLLAALLAVVGSAGIAHAASTTFTVTNTGDTGAGSLRQAISDANANAGADTIEFDIPAAQCTTPVNVCTISPGSDLPFITEAVTIDGYTQTASSPNTLAVGSDAQLKVELDGTNVPDDPNIPADVSGFSINAPNSVVKGLVINRWSRGISVNAVGGNRIEGNYIGTDASGAADLGNSSDGVSAFNGASNNVIGGTSPAARNVISGNDDDGIQVFGLDGPGNRIEGNYIGTNASGTQVLGNEDDGVFISDATDNVVGGTSAGARNVISGNKDDGVHINNTDATGNRVEGNYIGANASGNGDLGNSADGVFIENAPDNVVGGTSAGARNVISGNDGRGVIVEFSGATGNRILRNSIFGNDDLGIDLFGGAENASGVTANDPGDADTGPNNRQNFPVITSATNSASGTTIEGALNSTPNDAFTLQFFSSAAADPSGFGEGETFAGQTNVTTNTNGNATFSFTTQAPVAGGRFITATATNAATSDTSEFSEAVEVEGNAPTPPQCADGIDNDLDGKTDFGGQNGDPGCESATDDSESPDPPVSPPGCTIVGTSGDDTLSGTSGNDTICGLGGNDTIYADSGDDTIKGGEDNDTISGGSGNDTLQGEGGDDTARGGAGSDDLSGGSGADKLYGEAGNDALNARDGVRGNDTANGGAGRDTCSADKSDRKVSCEK